MPHSRQREQAPPGSPPRAAIGAGRRLVYCAGALPDGTPCQAAVAARVAGLIVFSHEGMEAVAERVHSIRCSRCGSTNSIQPTSPLQASA